MSLTVIQTLQLNLMTLNYFDYNLYGNAQQTGNCFMNPYKLPKLPFTDIKGHTNLN